ncbi:MAG: pyruvate kinase [Omnitrophica bacterium RIFCSPLOWO2_12_FULL_44_17]|uniref:Pyruvate kinase n=1 Tax=Candidatus Danuiimicrobium aquiferis TaxID=1801832 RepID=A0A1G1L2W1_9BACT|nr:MAG: pyruvate kinase [Omnitrophica bacterium RIFCSPHIGHO2_02_FULL_45_28]OGW89662.1 MAG: pyruvate kinase [Omnitrophica bacterium RIFCSPHIGHO2_12_FULL_44_12]OGW99472.1 MAG: pyruvate kinase [Omnitrophica bacterium RIFCSPLOWO2_12_FULL_44_17]OGX04308.1 MAG: pyruvate kinase [Omnitrophica bacterium RIFCSPLOWO2_02_FULL_44_11]
MTFRRTKIVATVGPACDEGRVLDALIHAGVNVFRVNTSHSSPSELVKWISTIRRISADEKKEVSILVDLQGPRLRTGRLKDGKPLNLRKGAVVTFFSAPGVGFGNQIYTPYKQFSRMVQNGDRILLDNGLIELRVLRVKGLVVYCLVVTSGSLGENKGINLPNAPDTLPALNDRDREMIRITQKNKADFIALSFVRSPKDVLELKKFMKRTGQEIPVIAKIEKPSALKCLKQILKVADGIMVARGDLGIEMGVEKVPVAQKRLINQANASGKPVIVATQMLESMMDHPRPTRAEASDVANAVFDGTDAVMLSGETSIGKYPIKTVRTMAKIIDEAESHQQMNQFDLKERYHAIEDLRIHAITHAAYEAAKNMKVKAMLAITYSGRTAALISKMKPKIPIFAFSSAFPIRKKLNLYYGVYPIAIKKCPTIDEILCEADGLVIKRGLLNKGDVVIVVSGDQELPGARYIVKIHQVGER